VRVVFHCEGGTDIASVSKQSAEKDVKTQERWRKESFRLLGVDDGNYVIYAGHLLLIRLRNLGSSWDDYVIRMGETRNAYRILLTVSV
jgi:hypothetical protein